MGTGVRNTQFAFESLENPGLVGLCVSTHWDLRPIYCLYSRLLLSHTGYDGQKQELPYLMMKSWIYHFQHFSKTIMAHPHFHSHSRGHPHLTIK